MTHRVEDFDLWVGAYNAVGELRQERGIGQAANQSHTDPSVAVVYHQADSFDTQ